MQIVSFNSDLPVRFTKSSGTRTFLLKRGEPHVFSDTQLTRLYQDQPHTVAETLRKSRLEGRLVQFNTRAYDTGSIMIYNGASGYGDQVMTMPVGNILAKRGFDVHILADPGNSECWTGVDYVKSMTLLPCPLHSIAVTKHHALFEVVTNHDEHPGQLHPVDTMLRRIGIDPASVPDTDKVFPVPVLEDERQAVASLTESRPYGVFQLSSASPARSLTPDKSAFVLRNLALEFPGLDWYAVYDAFIPTTFTAAAKVEMPGTVTQIAFPNFRHLFALIAGAKICVAPDSIVGHVAGSHGVPCIGLWGPTDPRIRMSYYANHVALTNRDSCDISPCLVHRGVLPPPFCPSLARRVCACVDDIDASRVLLEAHKFLDDQA